MQRSQETSTSWVKDSWTPAHQRQMMCIQMSLHASCIKLELCQVTSTCRPTTTKAFFSFPFHATSAVLDVM